MSDEKEEKVVVLLSGGQDSTTCLFWALARGVKHVHALSIWYGQRHDIELEAARKVIAIAKAGYPEVKITHEEHRLADDVLHSTSPLVSGNSLGQYDNATELPDGVEPTFVPGRNLLFFVLAANRAAEIGSNSVVAGVCEEDFGGYYDCRRDFCDAAEIAIAQAFVGTNTWLNVMTPLMRLSKSATVRLAESLPFCMDALAFTHTCYSGAVPPCGKCHACLLRSRGFEEAKSVDPLITRVESADFCAGSEHVE
jgi:7-cyano-7-deazaguanine synthase